MKDEKTVILRSLENYNLEYFLFQCKCILNPYFHLAFSVPRYKRHQNKVKVEGVGLNISYLARFLIFFIVPWKSSITRLKKLLTIYLTSIKTKVAIKFPKKNFFSVENQLGGERVNVSTHLGLSINVSVVFHYVAKSRCNASLYLTLNPLTPGNGQI